MAVCLLRRLPGRQRCGRQVAGPSIAGSEPAARPQRGSEGGARLVAVTGRLGQRPAHDLVDRGRQLGANRLERRGRRRKLGPEDGDTLVPLERRRAGQHLEGAAGQRVQVGAAVDRAALDLLGRHVIQRAEELAGGEVDMIRLAASGHRADEHVARLHITVHQAAGVRLIQGRRHLADDVRHARRWQRALAIEQRAQVLPGDVTHRDEQAPVRLARVEDGNDVRMIDGRGGPHLPAEPLAERRVPGELGRQDLQRHRPAQPRVERTVDDRHPAAADLLLDLVAGDLRADREVARRQRYLAHRASAGFSRPPGAPAPPDWPWRQHRERGSPPGNRGDEFSIRTNSELSTGLVAAMSR